MKQNVQDSFRGQGGAYVIDRKTGRRSRAQDPTRHPEAKPPVSTPPPAADPAPASNEKE
ncbi:MAG: hypothetical protein ACPHN2_04815 [Sinimarinibacterium flocculans]|uniref:hypothetical protein n=1 Tax=Sinimarinibacterium flocculans TaxID=985250 RepID=UPI003C4CB5CC